MPSCKITLSFFICFSLCSTASFADNATAKSLAELKKQVEILRKRIEQLEKEQIANTANHKSPSKQIKSSSAQSSTSLAKIATKNIDTKKNSSAKVYATLRPTFGYIDEQNISQWDVRDALSHAGFKFTNEFKPGWTAEAQGEWGVDLSNNGDFGKTRRAYVALDSPYGRVGIGKQRPPQYLLIAEYVDIFDHGNSPFAYDPQSIFFVNNLVTYKFKFDNFTWLAAAQFDGANGDDNSDLVNLGLSFDQNSFHAAITYLTEDQILNGVKTGEDDVIAAALAYNLTTDWYLAAGYQQRDYRDDVNLLNRTGHTIDLSSAYQLSKMFRLKLGYFDFDDGHHASLSQNFNGYNTTLEWLPAPLLRFHIEYLKRDFDYLPDFSSWSVGFRYDFSKQWRF